jgi:hypothetical protein
VTESDEKKGIMINFRHIFAEVECDLFGHIPSTSRRYAPLVVMNHYPDGTIEKIADDVCENCGHHLIRGLSKLRKGTQILPEKNINKEKQV